MAVPMHYGLLGGVAYGIGSFADPAYWIICIPCFFWNRENTQYRRPAVLSSVLALLYHFLLDPKLSSPDPDNEPTTFAAVFGIIVTCLIINGIFLAFSRLRRARNEAEHRDATSQTPPTPPATKTVAPERAPETEVSSPHDTPTAVPAQWSSSLATPPAMPSAETATTQADTAATPGKESVSQDTAGKPEVIIPSWREVLLGLNLIGLLIILLCAMSIKSDLKKAQSLSQENNIEMSRLRHNLQEKLKAMIYAQSQEMRQSEMLKPPTSASPPDTERDRMTGRMTETMDRQLKADDNPQ